ncbi:MAG: DUF3880 domain-containing protein [Desulfovibrio sp.]|nr:DUF3880 domain-containing protein [Desulfovibrio sp.]
MAMDGNWRAWIPLSEGENVLLLGLGPTGADIPSLLLNRPVFWLDSPSLLEATGRERTLPASWRKASPEEAIALFPAARCYFYRPGLRIDPFFWQPFLGRLFATADSWSSPSSKAAPQVLLFGNSSDLLHSELLTALMHEGSRVVSSLPVQSGTNIETLLCDACQGSVPSLCLSVNGRGLDADGRIFGLLEALRVPVVIWFVDNPFHVLSRIKLPFWKRATLFVTDASFIPLLVSEGARHVRHLPLAVAWHMWRDLPCENPRALQGHAESPPLFVGRSAFPDKNRYFAAVRLPKALEMEACSLDRKGEVPDIHWWYRKARTCFWPGHDVRMPGLGAEMCSQKNRTRWLSWGLKCGMRIVGDEGWRKLLPGAQIDAPVDYYGTLPDLYYRALATLNVTSWQLPASLSQRHFDVWASGGFLLSDATRGLSIFPEELVRPITVEHPSLLGNAIGFLKNHREEGLLLRKAWRAHLLEKHTYSHRLNDMRQACM